MTAKQFIRDLQDAWDRAHDARAKHYRAHREQRSWNPLGTQSRSDADLRAWREHERLDLAERVARERLASAIRIRRLCPLPSGLYAKLPQS